jgi:large subunit ribosomal protein L25
MASMVVEAEPRSSFGKGPNRRLRASGKVPAILYGAAKEPVALAVDPKQIVKIIRSHGGINTIFELSIEGAKGAENVMITDYQIEPVAHDLLHADLLRVAMDKAMELDVSVELTGTAVGVKTGGGMLDFVTRTVEVSCLPKDIPETIAVDVSALDIGDYIRVSDLEVPEGVTVISEGNVVIAHVLAPKAEEEEEPTEEEAAAAAAEGEAAEGEEGEGKEDKGESAEGGPAKD